MSEQNRYVAALVKQDDSDPAVVNFDRRHVYKFGSRTVAVAVDGLPPILVSVPFTFSDDVMVIRNLECEVDIDHDSRGFYVSRFVVFAPDSEGTPGRITPEMLASAHKAISPEVIARLVLIHAVSEQHRGAEGPPDAETSRKLWESIDVRDQQYLTVAAASGSKHSRIQLDELMLVARTVKERPLYQKPYRAVMGMTGQRKVGRTQAYELINRAVSHGFLTKEDLT